MPFSLEHLIVKTGLLLFTIVLLLSPWLYHLHSAGRFDYAELILTYPAQQIAQKFPQQVLLLSRYLTVRMQDSFAILIFSAIAIVWGIRNLSKPLLMLSLWILALLTLPLWAALVNPVTSIGSILVTMSPDRIAISLSLPAAVLAAVTLTKIFSRLQNLPDAPRARLEKIYLAALVVLALAGFVRLSLIREPRLELVTNADLEAMDWIKHNLPKDSKFLINMYFWGGNSIMGNDAGYWLPLLAQRQTTVPPLIYTTEGMSMDKLLALREIADKERDGTIDDPEQLCWLRRQGIDYIYVGARPGGVLTSQRVERNTGIRPLFRLENVGVYNILACETRR